MSSQARSSNPTTLDSRSQLLQYLEDGSDVVLLFKDEDGTWEEVPGHSIILKQWSATVLAEAMNPQRKSSSSNSSKDILTTIDDTTGKLKITMPDTAKDDWLLAMEFVYPISMRPSLNWDKLEALLALGDKYGMPALQQKLSFNIASNAASLNLNSSDNAFVWKWILIADRCGLHSAACACIDSQQQVAALMAVRPDDALTKLSRTTLHHLVKAMKPWLVKPGEVYCRKCARITAWKGTYNKCCSMCECDPFKG